MLRLRPFLLLAIATGSGAGIGSAIGASQSGFRTFSVAPTVLLLICIASALWLRWKPRAAVDVALLPLGLFLVFAVASQQRQLPPQSDVARLVRGIPVPDGPQKPLSITLNGTVAGAPRRNEFAIQFPFILDERASRSDGRIWIEAPRSLNVREGDALVLQAKLQDLPRAGNKGERRQTSRLVAARCWTTADIKAEDARVVRRAQSSLSTWLDDVRLGLQSRYIESFQSQNRPYSGASAQLLGAMVFGDRAGEPLPQGVRDSFLSAGLTHLLVASGTQVALLCALVLGAGRLIGLRGAWLLVGVVPILFFYALLTGGAASIWRATAAGICVALAVSLGRPVDRVTLLSIAFVALLCIDIAQIQDIGFQLTFAAAWGLAVVAPVLARNIKWLVGNALLAEIGAATLAAQLATVPITLYHFGRGEPHAFIANALVLPLSALLVGGGLLGLVWPAWNGVNYILVNAVRAIASDVSTWRGAGATSTPMNFYLTFAIAALLMLATSANAGWLRDARAIWRDETSKLKPTLRRNARMIGVVCAIVLGLSLWHRFGRHDGLVRVALLDVGQGESIVITHRDRAVVIDCGTTQRANRGDVGAAVLVPYLHARGVRRLDAIIATHPDADHVNGFETLLAELPVDLAIDGAANEPAWQLSDSPEYLALRAELKRRQIKTIAPRAGQTLQLGEARLRFLAPHEPRLPGHNNNAAVIMLEHGSQRILLTADIEEAGEARLIKRHDIRCDILKVAHHGSNTSSTDALLQAANPRTAILSCGRYNTYGHPHPQVLERLFARGITVLRTDRDGAITIVSDGKTAQIETYR